MLSQIDPSNASLKFLDNRILSNQYRGLHSSQHNRYTMEQFVKILELLDKYAPKGALLPIRTQDTKKRPTNTPEEEQFAHFCNEAKTLVGIGTQDAMRKNLFVDFHRMGLIVRFNKHKIKTDPYKQTPIKYVGLSEQGLKLVRSNRQLDKYFIFSKGIDALLSGSINYILDLLRDPDYGLNKITLDEYMFFVSAIGLNTDFGICVEECATLIKSFRILGLRKKAVIEQLKMDLKPENFSGNKTNKRDFQNWRNEAQQVFSLLTQTVYFEIRKDELTLRIGAQGFASETEVRLSRSLNEKHLYFSKHGITKKIGFELHHVVPLAYAESKEQFKLLDTWENMVYIDAGNHSKITQNKNRNIFMKPHSNDIELDECEHSKSKNSVYFKYQDNILYLLDLQSTMLRRNRLLINDMPES